MNNFFDEIAENSILGAILISPKEIDKIIDVIEVDDFYFAKNREIYKSILNVYNASSISKIDHISVNNDLELRNFSGLVGGIEHLFALSDNLRYSNIEEHANIIKNYSLCRKLLGVISNIEKKVLSTKNSEESIEFAQNEIYNIINVNGKEGFVRLSDIYKKQIVLLHELTKNKSEITGVSTGLIDLDKITSGFQKQNMIILAARPSMGKTALSLNFCINAAREKKTVAIFSLEMSKSELSQRILSYESNINLKKILSGQLSDDELLTIMKAINNLSFYDIYIDDQGAITPLYIKSQLRKLSVDKKIDLVMVDYLQLMNSGEKTLENRNLEIAKISMAMKNLAKEFNVPMLVLSQLNRSVETRADKIPLLSDLRDSGSIEQDADIVMFLHREYQINKQREELKNLAELSVAKHRNGETGIIKLFFDGERQKFANLAKEHLKNIESSLNRNQM